MTVCQSASTLALDGVCHPAGDRPHAFCFPVSPAFVVCWIWTRARSRAHSELSAGYGQAESHTHAPPT